MTPHHPTPGSGPTPACATFAAVLPVLDEPGVDARLAAAARTHLVTCPTCRAQLATYDTLDAALRRQLGPAATPCIRTEDIMRDLMHDDQTTTTVSTTTASPPPVSPPTPAPRGRRPAAWLAPIAAVLLLSVVAAALFTARAHQPPATPATATATPATSLARGAAIELNAIAMTSPSDGWAVGFFRPATDSDGSATQVALMHVTNGTWSTVHVPILGSLNAISMLSASDGWAVGDQGLILHFDGHSWARVPSPTQTFLYAVQMLAPNDGWAVGDGDSPGRDDSILHYDGAAWTPQPLPASLGAGTRNAISLYGLAMASPAEGWAVGAMQPIIQPTPGVSVYYPTTPPTALILRYAHGRWTVAATIPGATLQSVALTPSGGGWAAGRTDTFVYGHGDPDPADVFSPLLLRLTGSSWARVTSPAASDSFLAVLAGPANASWLVVGSDRLGVPGLLRFDGRAWSAASIPTLSDTRQWVIRSLAMPILTEGWAVGYRLSNQDNGIPSPTGYGYQPTVTPVILHYLHGQWSVYMS